MTSPLAEVLMRAFGRQMTSAYETWEEMLPLYAELGYESEDALRLAGPQQVRRQVRQLAARTLVDEGVSQREAARRLGVHHSTVAADIRQPEEDTVADIRHPIQMLDEPQVATREGPSREAQVALAAIQAVADIDTGAVTRTMSRRQNRAIRAAIRRARSILDLLDIELVVLE